MNKDMVIAQLCVILIALLSWFGAYVTSQMVDLKDRVYRLEAGCP